jgi:uncharacterized protein (UPF0332 family)
MTLAADLLEQARTLAKREPKRPRQASLRRAVSSAYYALFHQLTEAASRDLITGTDCEILRNQVRRAFKHTEMKEVCHALAKWQPKQPPLRLAGLFAQSPSQDIQCVASAFVEMQQARHDADYDALNRFSRDDVLTLVETAEQAFSIFNGLPRKNTERRNLLVALAFYKRWQQA